jgi:hypothetical protein
MSLLNLFAAGTLDNWSSLMYMISNYRGINMQPIDNTFSTMWFFVFFIFITMGSFICMQLFVGAITASFEKSKMELGGLSYLTKEQQEWVRTRKIVKAISPIKKINRDNIDSVQKFFFDVCESTFFFVFILLCIFMQIIVLSLYSFKQTDNTATFQNNTEVILTVVFTMEMLCKIMAYRK